MEVTVGRESDDTVGALNEADWDALRQFIAGHLRIWKRVGSEWHFYPAKQVARLMKAVIYGSTPSPLRHEPCAPLGWRRVYFSGTIRKWAKNLVNNVRGKCRSRAELEAMRAAIARAMEAVPHDNPE
ncbi:MAG: hypothetical protein HYY10_04450 [Candidatus Liptonbacteria bacterium]|nr:hypothetical protein [Candidatus Liptonbacteria bacterium]